MKHTITYGHATDRGLKRPDNQDCYGKFPEQGFDLTDEKGQLFIVADGMGGLAAGREASETAVQTIQQVYFSDENRAIPNRLKHAFEAANSEIYTRAQTLAAQNKMGTTGTALVLTEKFAHLAHVGDSRAYHITKNKIKQLTSDHTYVAEMQRKKILTKQQAQNHIERSVLYRALGIDPSVAAEIIPKIAVHPGDYFLLHTDGLNQVSPKEIQHIVLSNPPQHACEKLIQLANERGGEDNCTVQIIQIHRDRKKLAIPGTMKMWQSLISLKWLVIGLLLVVALIFSWYRLTDRFRKSAEKIADVQQFKNRSMDTETSTGIQKNTAILTLFEEANNIFSRGHLDSALIIYQSILKSEPMHIGAIDGMNRLVNEYKKRADYFRSQNNFSMALHYYQKLATILPRDKGIYNLISVCEFKLQNTQKNEIRPDSSTKTDSVTVGMETADDEDKSARSDTIVSIGRLDWDFKNLHQQDYWLLPDSLLFYQTIKQKKAICRNDFRDIDIEVIAQNLSNGTPGEYGIIFGYIVSEQTDQNSFLLYALNESGNLLLRKVTPDRNEILFTIVKNDLLFTSEIKKLKVRCIGSWIMAYGEDRLLKVWNEEKLIIGKVGLFADPYLQIEFTQFKITPLISHTMR